MFGSYELVTSTSFVFGSNELVTSTGFVFENDKSFIYNDKTHFLISPPTKILILKIIFLAMFKLCSFIATTTLFLMHRIGKLNKKIRPCEMLSINGM